MPIFHKLTKMVLVVLGGLVLSFLLLSCGKKSNTSPEDTIESPEVSDTAENSDSTAEVPDSTLISAGDVKDRESLMAFVLAAQKEIEEKSFFGALPEFKKEGRWKQGSIYLFVISQDGITLVHANPDFVSKNQMDYQDPNGVMVVQELIKVANAGGGFVEYLIDNPEKEGEDNSPKVSYAIKTDFDYVLGSGFYK